MQRLQLGLGRAGGAHTHQQRLRLARPSLAVPPPRRARLQRCEAVFLPVPRGPYQGTFVSAPAAAALHFTAATRAHGPAARRLSMHRAPQGEWRVTDEDIREVWTYRAGLTATAAGERARWRAVGRG